jgi:putative transposase
LLLVVSNRQLPFRALDEYGEVNVTRRRLPHWHQSGVAYFVTFRLADSLPQSLLSEWRDERAIWLRWHPEPWLAAEEREYEERFMRRIQEWLDAGMGACYLRRPEVRTQVADCLLHFDGTRYDVDAFVLMPNHVHAIIVPRDGYDLSALLRGMKGVSANRCNKLLGSDGVFWMDESYDHIVRDANELNALRDYIAANPKEARLQQDEYTLQVRNILVT